MGRNKHDWDSLFRQRNKSSKPYFIHGHSLFQLLICLIFTLDVMKEKNFSCSFAASVNSHWTHSMCKALW